MPRLRTTLLLLILAPPTWAEPPGDAKRRTDQYGDPLPEGVKARLGSTRFHVAAQTLITDAAFSPDGRVLAATFSDKNGNGVTCLDVATGKEIRRFEVPGKAELRRVVYSPNGKWLGARGEREIFFWDMTSPSQIGHFLPEQQSVNIFAFLPDGRTIVTASRPDNFGDDSLLRFWDLTTGLKNRQLSGHKSLVVSIVSSFDGKKLITQSIPERNGEGKQQRTIPGAICFWNLTSGELIQRHKLPDGTVEISQNGKFCIVEGADESRRVCEFETMTELFGIDNMTQTQFTPDDRILAIAPDEIRLLDVPTAKVLRHLEESRGLCSPGRYYAETSFSADGKLAAVWRAYGGTTNQTFLRVWNLTTGREVWPPEGHRSSINSLALSVDGKRAGSASDDGTVRLWDTATAKTRRVYAGHGCEVTNLALAPDNMTIASADRANEVHLWTPATGALIRRLSLGEDLPYGVVLTFTPDSRMLVLQVPGNSVLVVDAKTGENLRRFEPGYEFLQWMTLPRDGRLLATLGTNETGYLFTLWDFATGRELCQVQPECEQAEAFGRGVFSEDGKYLAISRYLSSRFGGDTDHGIRIWEVATGKEVAKFAWPDGSWPFVFSPGGREIIGTSAVGKVQLFDLQTEQRYQEYTSHLDSISALALSADGRTLVSASMDSTLLVWDAAAFASRARQDHPLSPKALTATWERLNGADAITAYRAMWDFLRLPEASVAFLRELVRPVPQINAKRIANLIDSLDSDRYEEREHASRELGALAEQAEPALRRVLANPHSPETGRRVKRLLAPIEKGILAGSQLQAVRVTALLERIGTPKARQVLVGWASGAPEARLTREAKAAVHRLEQRVGRD
jgi:WD40 repeat protein